MKQGESVWYIRCPVTYHVLKIASGTYHMLRWNCSFTFKCWYYLGGLLEELLELIARFDVDFPKFLRVCIGGVVSFFFIRSFVSEFEKPCRLVVVFCFSRYVWVYHLCSEWISYRIWDVCICNSFATTICYVSDYVLRIGLQRAICFCKKEADLPVYFSTAVSLTMQCECVAALYFPRREICLALLLTSTFHSWNSRLKSHYVTAMPSTGGGVLCKLKFTDLIW